MFRRDAARWCFAGGALLAAADVGLRAWQAHGLAHSLDAEGLRLFEAARGHQFGCALGLMLCGLLRGCGGGRLAALAGAAFAAGAALFCGDVYQAAFAAEHAAIGVAPAGGIVTMAAWLLLAADALARGVGAGTQIRTGG